MESDDTPLQNLSRAAAKAVFRPIFMNFPFLDRFPIPSRVKARQLVRAFNTELSSAICTSYRNMSHKMSSDQLVPRMVTAQESGILTPKQMKNNFVGIFIAGNENPRLLLISLMYILGKHPVSRRFSSFQSS